MSAYVKLLPILGKTGQKTIFLVASKWTRRMQLLIYIHPPRGLEGNVLEADRNMISWWSG